MASAVWEVELRFPPDENRNKEEVIDFALPKMEEGKRR